MQAPGKKKHVLIAAGPGTYGDLAQAVVEIYGHEAFPCYDLDEIIGCLDFVQSDLALLGFSRPLGDVNAMIIAIRRSRQPRIPIIGFGPTVTSEQRDAFQGIGFDDLWFGPPSATMFMNVISKWIPQSA